MGISLLGWSHGDEHKASLSPMRSDSAVMLGICELGNVCSFFLTRGELPFSANKIWSSAVLLSSWVNRSGFVKGSGLVKNMVKGVGWFKHPQKVVDQVVARM